MRDFRRDWQKWSMAERITALLIVTLLALALPAAVAAKIHPAAPVHSAIWH
jgi:hypothetical protein